MFGKLAKTRRSLTSRSRGGARGPHGMNLNARAGSEVCVDEIKRNLRRANQLIRDNAVEVEQYASDHGAALRSMRSLVAWTCPDSLRENVRGQAFRLGHTPKF